MKMSLYLLVLISSLGCKSLIGDQNDFDTIIHNAVIYTVHDTAQVYNTIGITDGKISYIGVTYDPETTADTVIDAKGQFLMPGFIEGHGHYAMLGYSLLDLNFLKSPNWDSISAEVVRAAANLPKGTWVVGRGWHQDKWDASPSDGVLGYPNHKSISRLTPDHPVILIHASGHSLFANEAAMKSAGISAETPDPAGGHIVRDGSGAAIGVFEERAMTLIRDQYNTYKDNLPQETILQRWYDAVSTAEQHCLQYGITSFQDAGSKFDELDRYAVLAEEGKLKVRLWAMARHSHAEMKDVIASYRKIGLGNDFYTCRAIKSEVDGALGAYGAWLLAPYSDKPGWMGQNTTDVYEVKRIADLALAHDMQLCVHAIGDRANRVVVDIYEGVLSGAQSSNHRWRIEHAQHLDTTDIPRMANNEIIASVQGIHCTSDALFVEKRLGFERSKYGAYPWRRLLDAGVRIANGTDAPVEEVDPLQSFYASVTRKRADNGFEFFPEQAMTRVEALKSYTLDNAYAAFEEDIKGSIGLGKYADLVLLDHNLLTCSDAEILDTKVLWTMVGGKVRYRNQ